MAVKSIASVKADFVSAAVPTESQFIDLIDSTYTGEIGNALVSAVGAGSAGLFEVVDASSVSFLVPGSAGRALVSAGTAASARTVLGAASAGDAIFITDTFASVRSVIGAASTSAATTASAGIIEIATTAEAITGTDDSKAITPATRLAAGRQLLHVRDEKTSGTNGGTFTSGSYQTRTLNTTLTNEITGASLSSNQITLPAGTYLVEASAPALNVDDHKVRLRNVTDGTDLIIGTSERSGAADSVATRSGVRGRFTLAAQKTLELQHRCVTTKSTNGFGEPAAFGDNEVYAEAMIWRVG